LLAVIKGQDRFRHLLLQQHRFYNIPSQRGIIRQQDAVYGNDFAFSLFLPLDI
jgi:hypothetical protein